MNKLCELEDWKSPSLRRYLKALHLRPDYLTRSERKHWEWAMGLRGLERAGCVTPTATGLGIGAGHEPPVYYLARRTRLVIATDLYGQSPFCHEEAHEMMWRCPQWFAPFAYPRERLLVMQMDGADIPYGDASFDFAFSFSAIEHFGALTKIQRSMREVSRVLRPGGVYALATECVVAHPPGRRPRVPGVHLFTPEEIQRVLIDGSGLRLTEPIDFTLSATTRRHCDDLERIVRTRRLRYPHLLVRYRRLAFTSLMLFLHKPA